MSIIFCVCLKTLIYTYKLYTACCSQKSPAALLEASMNDISQASENAMRVI